MFVPFLVSLINKNKDKLNDLLFWVAFFYGTPYKTQFKLTNVALILDIYSNWRESIPSL